MPSIRAKTRKRITQGGLALFFCLLSSFTWAADQGISPEPLPVPATIEINQGALYSNSTLVTLKLTPLGSSSSLSQMQFSQDNLSWSRAEAFATTKTWRLTLGDGQKTVYVRFKTLTGDWSTSTQDSIILDTTPPTLSIDPVNSPTNQNVSLSYTVSDNLTPTNEIVVTGDNSPYTQEGNYNISLTAQDLAGNRALSKTSFIIDKTPPLVKITFPQDGQVVEEATISLQGTIDALAFKEERSLTEGENLLTKTATDTAGNTASHSVTVYLYLGELIGPEGGEVSSADGRVKLSIPAYALTQAQQIKLLPLAKESFQSTILPKARALLSIVDCKPSGLVFSKPVQLSYILSQAEIPGTPVELALYDTLQNKLIPTQQTSTVPVDGYHLNFPVLHLATYAALKSITSQAQVMGGGVKIPLPDMFTGSFSHSIPLTLAPGRKGIQPQLALTYRSSNPNSWVGLGFSLNPGYIVRSTKLGPPKYNDTQDDFYLVTDSGTTEFTYLTDNLYQAKIESNFTKFFKAPDDTWKAVAKDGTTLSFGQSPDSKESSPQGTFSWYLTKAQDTNGNYIEYSYTKDQGKSYLKRIDYTGNENTGILPTNSVEFERETRTDISSSYLSSSRIATAQRLREIQVKVNADLVWSYILEYTYSPDTNRSLLKSITQSGSDGKSLPKQSFEYQEAK